MNLFEQFKKDINEPEQIVEMGIFTAKSEESKNLIKQSYLNAIDCMIGWNQGEYSICSDPDVCKELLEAIGYLQEQRNLIENYEI